MPTDGKLRKRALTQPEIDLGSIFLGPKGENAEVFEQMLLEAVRDHVFWRRNFHPEDGFQVEETAKRDEAYQHSLSVLRQELLGLLAELKAGVPFFSPRYIGHMTSDLTMASLIAYFATMLYNPNNIAAEASPVTTRMELEVAEQLARMVGYPPEGHWGHLTSGGTVANFEALWVGRNVKYLPLAAHWAAAELGLTEIEARLPTGDTALLAELGLWELLNIAPTDALDLVDALGHQAGRTTALAAVGRHSLAALGYQDTHRRLRETFGDPLPPAVVLAPSTAHYSWAKTCHALGIGGARLLRVPVDRRFRMDPDALATTLAALARERRPVIACVSVLGSTEESAVDRLDAIAEVRREAARRHGLAFQLHSDAAWGGYAVAITRNADGTRRRWGEAAADSGEATWPREDVYRALCAVDETDSVTIDPHKLGFVPYPAGAVVFRDRRVRELVAVDAPYLFHRGTSEWGYIGRFIFEGSKPGAAAAAVWMSHKVLPLDARGYGRLIGAASRAALALHRQVAEADWGPFRVVPLPEPDLNIVCFAVGHPDLPDLEATNALVEHIYDAMSVGGGTSAQELDYFVTQTVLRADEYGAAASGLVETLGFSRDDYLRSGGLRLIRCTVMDPFLTSDRGRVDFVAGFLHRLRREMERGLAAVTAAALRQRSG